MNDFLFGPDVRPSAEMTVALINTAPVRGGEEGLNETDTLRQMGRDTGVFYEPDGSKAEILAMRKLRADAFISVPPEFRWPAPRRARGRARRAPARHRD